MTLVKNLIKDFQLMKPMYPNTSLLWLSYLHKAKRNETLEKQALGVLDIMRRREIKDISKKQILAIYCCLYCDK